MDGVFLTDDGKADVILYAHADDPWITGRALPRMSFEFKLRTPRESMEANIHLLRVELRGKPEYNPEVLGIAVADTFSFDTGFEDCSLYLDVPVSREAVNWATEHSSAPGATSILLTMHAIATVTIRDSGEERIATAELRDRDWYDEGDDDTRDWSDEYSYALFDIPRSRWLESVMGRFGLGDYVFLEMLIPKPPDRERWEKSLRHIREAETFYSNGNDAQVLAACYAAFESFSSDPKRVFSAITDTTKRRHLDDLMIHTKNFLHSGRHVVRNAQQSRFEGDFDVDHRDATFALAVAKSWLVYTAQLLNGLG
jgi:hypothetical protein